MNFSGFLRSRFGGKTLKIAIDAGFTCPHAATGGCAWCDNSTFSASDSASEFPPLSADSVRAQIRAGIARAQKKHPTVSRFLIYFQPRTNTNADVKKLRELYSAVLTEVDVVGIAIGTRPDCVDPEKIAMLAELAKEKFVQIEYGLQSINDATLRAMNRGHSVADFSQAMAWSRDRGIYLCAHLIVGLPEDELTDSVRAAEFLAKEKIDGVKIHNLYITENTPLAKRFAAENFPFPTLEQYAQTVAQMLRALPETVTEQRLSAAPRFASQLIAPKWCLDASAVRNRIAELLSSSTYNHAVNKIHSRG